MTNEHMGTCIYEKGRFELRETDNAIIDLKGDFPPIMIASDIVDDGSEPNCADTRSVLHLLNELADNNPNEERHWYLKKMLDTAWEQYHEQKEENEQLKQAIETQNFNYENAKGVIHSSEHQIQQLQDENEQLKKEIMKWKEKYYYAEETVINEYSGNISKDMEELNKEVYGDVE